MLKTTMGRVLGTAILPVMLASCAGEPVTGSPDNGGDDQGLVGRATFAITGVPSDGTCLQLQAAGNRVVTRAFDAEPGSSMVFQLDGLPVGQVTFTAVAFGSSCAARGGMAPTWISDAPFTTTVATAPPALVTLNLVRDGIASVSVGFDDDAPSPGGAGTTGGGTGGTTGGGAAGSTGGSAGTGAKSPLVFMQVPSLQGASTVIGFENWFILDSFTFSSTTTGSIVVGGGGGAGKSTATATAKLHYQKGAPGLYNLSVMGKSSSPVKIVVEKAGAEPAVIWRASLLNTLISSITDDGSGVLPTLTVTLTFARSDLQFEGTINPDGSRGAPTLVTWDFSKSTGSGGGAVPFSFVIGGPATAPAKEISAFRAPSETNAGSGTVGAGGGAGKPVFGDASVTLPIDAAVLQYFLNQVQGRVLPTGSVQIDVAGDLGPTAFGTYGFNMIQLHSVTLTGFDATVGFGAAAFKWSVGTDLVTFP
jgi:type VI protein secretion system component Hcp